MPDRAREARGDTGKSILLKHHGGGASSMTSSEPTRIEELIFAPETLNHWREEKGRPGI